MLGSRRPLFELANIERLRKKKGKGGAISSVALEAVRRINEIFAIERDLSSLPPDQRLAERERLCVPLVDKLHTYGKSRLPALMSRIHTKEARVERMASQIEAL